MELKFPKLEAMYVFFFAKVDSRPMVSPVFLEERKKKKPGKIPRALYYILLPYFM